MTALKQETREKLKSVSTATLCTALYKRGLRNQFIQDVRPLNPDLGTMVGEAYTLRYIPAREDLDTLASFSRDDALQRIALEQCPPGFVLVIDARGDDRIACAGDMFVTRLMQRGCAGIVTDGGLRDVGLRHRGSSKCSCTRQPDHPRRKPTCHTRSPPLPSA